MKGRSIRIFSLLSLVIGMLLLTGTTLATAEVTHYTVVFKANKMPTNAASLIANAGGTLVASLPEVGVAHATSSNSGFASNLSGVNNVTAVGEMRFMTLPDTVAIESHSGGPTAADDLYHIYQWGTRRVNAEMAWNTTSGSHDTVVAVIDTGVAWNHPDLAPNVVYASCYAIGGPCSPYPNQHWHGTHVAGTIAAAFGHGRVVGVGPDLGIAGYNVFENINGCGVCGSDFAIWAAMLDAAAKDFDVINMSLGSYGVKSQDAAEWVAWNRVADYVTKQGVTIVASAGNGGENLNGQLFHLPSDVTGVINVSAAGIRPAPAYPQSGAYDVLAFYSNYGAPITLTAPGGECGLDDSCDPTVRPSNWFEYLVLSTYVIASPGCAATASCPVGYLWAAGTSMASPHVAGTAGLVMDVDPGLSPRQVTAILKQTAENLGNRQLFGHGMVDAAAAVERASK